MRACVREAVLRQFVTLLDRPVASHDGCSQLLSIPDGSLQRRKLHGGTRSGHGAARVIGTKQTNQRLHLFIRQRVVRAYPMFVTASASLMEEQLGLTPY